MNNLEELLEKEKNCTGEISQDSKSAIFIQISCFAAEIFYWYWKVSFSGKIGQNRAVFGL